MIATDRLIAMLKERGVEYVIDHEYGEKYPPEQRVTWSVDLAGEDMTVTARDYCIGVDENGKREYYCLDLEFHEVFTTEQAIAATLGRRTCHVMTIAEFNGEGTDYYDVCSNCGYEFDDYPLNYCPNCGREVVHE